MTDDNAQANPIDLGKLLVEDFPSALPALVNRVNLVDASFIEVGLAYARDAGNPRANRLAVLNACRHARLLGENKAEVTTAYDELQAETDRLEMEDAMARQDGPALLGLAGRLSTLKDLRENPLYQDIPPMLLDYFKRSLEQKYLALAAYTDQALSLLGEEGAPERQARLDAVRDELVAEKNRLLQARLDETLTRVRKKEQALEAVLFTENYLNALINRKRKSPSPTPGALVGEAEQTIQAFADRFYEIEDEPEYAQSLARLEAARRELVKAQEERNRHADALPVEKSAEGGGSKWAYLNFAVGLASLLGVLGIAYHLFVNQPIQNQKESNALVRTVSALIYGTPVVPTRTPVSTFTPYRTATTYRSITPYRSVTPAITSAPAALKWAFDYPADECVSMNYLYDLPPIRLPKEQGGGWKLAACTKSSLGICYIAGIQSYAVSAQMTLSTPVLWKTLDGVQGALDDATSFVIRPDPGNRDKPIKPLAVGSYRLQLTYEGDKTSVNTYTSFRVQQPYITAFTGNLDNNLGFAAGVVREEPFGTSDSRYFNNQAQSITGLEVLGWSPDLRKTDPRPYIACVRLAGQRFDDLWIEGQTLYSARNNALIPNDASLWGISQQGIPRLELAAPN